MAVYMPNDSGFDLCLLQQLYDSEINFVLQTFWDGGFDWKLGDKLNGFREQGNADTFEEACAQLCQAAIQCYPESVFAKEYP